MEVYVTTTSITIAYGVESQQHMIREEQGVVKTGAVHFIEYSSVSQRIHGVNQALILVLNHLVLFYDFRVCLVTFLRQKGLLCGVESDLMENLKDIF